MNKFKIGDKVRVYDYQFESGYRILKIQEITSTWVFFNEYDNGFHYKQCRKLRPRKKKVTKEIVAWANVYPRDHYAFHKAKEIADQYGDGTNRIACVKVTGTYEVEE
jgi:hypothetical protein